MSESLLSSYQHHWICYQQGTKYLDNLFSYFNRVTLRKYQPQHDVLTCHVMGLATPLGPSHKTADTPIQIRYVSVKLLSLPMINSCWWVWSLQMALKVWKNKILEVLRQQLVATLLEEIRR